MLKIDRWKILNNVNLIFMVSNNRSSYDQNIGRPGVVYILVNPGLSEGYIKIGCSRYSGRKRAEDLNLNANTGTPGSFKCIYEMKTQDCGRAEQEVFKILEKYRRGKKGQEFFHVSFNLAKQVIEDSCAKFNKLNPASPENTFEPVVSIAPVIERYKETVIQHPLIYKSQSRNWTVIITIFVIFILMQVLSSNSKHKSQAIQTYAEPQAVKANEEPAAKAVQDYEFTDGLYSKELKFDDLLEPKVPTSKENLDTTNLNETEKVIDLVKEAEYQANLAKCLNGRYPALCDHSLLNQKAD